MSSEQKTSEQAREIIALWWDKLDKVDSRLPSLLIAAISERLSSRDAEIERLREWQAGLATTTAGGIMRVEQRTGRDCLRCCLAMVTRIDYDDVPDFVADYGESWPTACEAWLSGLGMGLLVMPTAPTYVPPWLPIIARGSTEYSDVHHFVVVTPNAVIDPSPSQHRLKEAAATYAVVNSGSLANDFIGHLAAKYSAAHSALSSRDREVTQVLESLSDDGCYDACFLRWMKRYEDSDGFEHSEACLSTAALYTKLQPRKEGENEPV